MNLQLFGILSLTYMKKRGVWRRTRLNVRIYAYLCFFAVVTAGACWQAELAVSKMTRIQAAADARLIYRLTEEVSTAASLCNAAEEKRDQSTALQCSCALIEGFTAMLESYPAITGIGNLFSAVAHTQTTADDPSVPSWLADCTEQCARLLSDLSVLLLSGVRADANNPVFSDIFSKLDTLCAGFAPDPLKTAYTAVKPEYSFAAESAITADEAEKTLRAILGAANARLLHLTDKPDMQADQTDSTYLFTCQNSYAEISAHGGHLLRCVFYPTASISAHTLPPAQLCDMDLSAAANAFLDKNAIIMKLLSCSSAEDKHGLRYYTYAKQEIPAAVIVGVRMSDGKVLYYDAERYYRK